MTDTSLFAADPDDAAEDENAVREHAEISGFPATRIVEITKVIDPSTARA